ncbi:MAG: hypothetical protein JRN52_05355 [Nitrososphaerota archaeon]|nr:hypothetical protein [Nitrososphaerota archaeon]
MASQSNPTGRKEDRRLVTGKGRFVDDLQFEGQLYLGLVRSPYAHARIKRIDLSRAMKSSDFVGSLTGEDLLKLGILSLCFRLRGQHRVIILQSIESDSWVRRLSQYLRRARTRWKISSMRWLWSTKRFQLS